MPSAARLGDQVSHTSALGGLLGGVLIGAVVGAAAVATVTTGGLAAAPAALIVGAVCTGGSLGGSIGRMLGSMNTTPKGPIITGAKKVGINGKAAARACIDVAACIDHKPPAMVIAQGSMTVSIEGYPAARVDDAGTCGFKIGEGSQNVFIGGRQGTCPGLSIDSEVPWYIEHIPHALGLVGASGFLRYAGYGALTIGRILVGGEIGSQAGGHVGGKLGGGWGGLVGSLIGEVIGGGVAGGFRRPPSAAARRRDPLPISTNESWGNPNTLARHFRDHGADFRAKSADEYARLASEFLQRSQAEDLPTKIGPDGVIRIWDPNTNTFGAYNPDGTTRSFYKPQPRSPSNPRGHHYLTNLDYWDAQPGSAPWTP